MWWQVRQGTPRPTGRERPFPDGEVIVSKTDPRGIITYANPLFCEICGYAPHELIGRPHRIVRHPLMPACIFRRMWSLLKAGSEVFVGVVNLCRNGDHYWVFAHVTPTITPDHRVVGYHSTRRTLPERAKERLEALYRELREIERRHADPRAGMDAADRHLDRLLEPVGGDFSRFFTDLVT